jgi:hypothetical protein
MMLLNTILRSSQWLHLETTTPILRTDNDLPAVIVARKEFHSLAIGTKRRPTEILAGERFDSTSTRAWDVFIDESLVIVVLVTLLNVNRVSFFTAAAIAFRAPSSFKVFFLPEISFFPIHFQQKVYYFI